MKKLKTQPGETLCGIAKRHGVDITALLIANPEIINPNVIRSGQTLHIPLKKIPTTQSRDDDRKLGSLSAEYESKGDPGTVSPGKDRGGKSYGVYQFSSTMGSLKEFLTWLGGHHSQFHSQLAGAMKTDGNWFGPSFDRAWKSIGESHHDEFYQLQHKHTKEKFYDKAAKILKQKKNFDINTRSLALKNVLCSTAVQHGVGNAHGAKGAVGIFSKASLQRSDEQIIKAVYQERSAVVSPAEAQRKGPVMTGPKARKYGIEGKVMKHFAGNPSDTQVGVYKRLAIEEKEKALNMLKGSRQPNAKVLA